MALAQSVSTTWSEFDQLGIGRWVLDFSSHIDLHLLQTCGLARKLQPSEV